MTTLLFDIDGTLLLTNDAGGRAIRLALQQEFSVLSPSTDVDFSGRTDRSLLSELLVHNHLQDCEENRRRLRHSYADLFPTVLKQCGGTVLPGVIELLNRLAQHPEIDCHVMTGNLESTATVKLEHFGLHSFFRRIFGGDHDEQRNDLAIRTAGLIRDVENWPKDRKTIVIGDTPADVHCGHTIGAQVVAVCTGYHDRAELEAANPAWVHDDLSDVDTIHELLVSP